MRSVKVAVQVTSRSAQSQTRLDDEPATLLRHGHWVRYVAREKRRPDYVRAWYMAYAPTMA